MDGFIPIHPTVEKEKENGFEREEEDGEDEEMGLPNGVWVFIKWVMKCFVVVGV